MLQSILKQIFEEMFDRTPDFKNNTKDCRLACNIFYFFFLENVFEIDDKYNITAEIDYFGRPTEEYYLSQYLKYGTYDKKFAYKIKNDKIINVAKKVIKSISEQNGVEAENIFEALCIIKQLRFNNYNENEIKSKIEFVFPNQDGLYKLAQKFADELEEKKLKIELENKPVKYLGIETVIGNAFIELLTRTNGQSKTLNMNEILDYADNIEKFYSTKRQNVVVKIDQERLKSFFQNYRDYFNRDAEGKHQISLKDGITLQHLTNEFRWNLNESLTQAFSNDNVAKCLMKKNNDLTTYTKNNDKTK
ncbi:MAG: hypothetical protein ACI4R8_04030 [Candidatus Caccovivens sp.]